MKRIKEIAIHVFFADSENGESSVGHFEVPTLTQATEVIKKLREKYDYESNGTK